MSPALQTLSTEERAQQRALLVRELWRRGDLRYLMHADQRRVFEHWQATRGRFILEIARKWGKTWLLVLIAFMVCLWRPRSRVVYGAPTLKHLQEFILPVIDEICAHAPEEFRPVWSAARGHVEFHNGSVVHLFGADDKRKADRGRGPRAELAIFDEAGFTPILRYVLRSVFRPSLLPSGGRVLLGSTPAAEPDHDFTGYAEQAESLGNYDRRTVWDNPLLTREQVQAFIEEDARDDGLTPEAYQDTDEFRREYLAERVVDRLLVVVPEWRTMREKCFVAVERPPLFDALTWLDFGGADPHAVLFGYYDFKLAKTVIVDELLLRNGENTKQLADAIKAKERELWGTTQWEGTLRAAYDADYQLMRASLPDWMADAADEEAPQQPYARWADNNLQLCRDLHELHGLTFAPTAKDDKQLQVNNFRVMVGAGEVLVNPRCVGLDRHLRTTVWENARRRGYRRIMGEHGDLLDCAVYGTRNLYKRNPYPIGWGIEDAAQLRRVLAAAEKPKTSMLGDSPLARRLAGR